MSKQVSPFAALTGAEKQIRWLEYQSIKLPYVDIENVKTDHPNIPSVSINTTERQQIPTVQNERPQPPPEVPRTYNPDLQKSKHSQYDAVVARLKQAELQARRHTSQLPQQLK